MEEIKIKSNHLLKKKSKSGEEKIYIRGGGKARKDPDERLIYDCARDLCTMEQIGRIVGVSVDTLERRFMNVIHKAKDEIHRALRAKQIEMALKGDRTMLVWLGKVELGQTEVKETATLEIEVRTLLKKMEELAPKS